MALLSGCAIAPDPISDAQISERVSGDKTELFAAQEPLTGELALEEAIARAIKYNMDHRLALMEEATAEGEFDVAKWQLLPGLTAGANQSYRSKPDASISETLETGTITTTNSFSDEKKVTDHNLIIAWNVLDFGVNFFQAKQQADRRLFVAETRRRILHELIREVRGVYWRAAGAQSLRAKVLDIRGKTEAALVRAARVREQRLLVPLESLRLERALTENLQQMEAIIDQLDEAMPQLASLINLPPGSEISLPRLFAGQLTVPELQYSLPMLEELALNNRPELRRLDYRERIGVNETRKAIARLLPGITFDAGLQHSSNRYAHNKYWADAGAQISWNLFNLIKGPVQLRAAKAQISIAKTERLALSMAILSQVHVAIRQFQGLQNQFKRARRLSELDEAIKEQVSAAQLSAAESEIENIRAASVAIKTELTMFQSFAQLRSALGLIHASLGLDPLPADFASDDLAEMSLAIADTLNQWNRGDFAFDLDDGAGALASLAPAAAATGDTQKAGDATRPGSAANDKDETIADSGNFYPRLLSWIAALFDAKPAPIPEPEPAPMPMAGTGSAPAAAPEIIVGDGAGLMRAITRLLGIASDAPAVPGAPGIIAPPVKTIKSSALELGPRPLNPPGEQEY
jgi:outer membrane protein TolC